MNDRITIFEGLHGIIIAIRRVRNAHLRIRRAIILLLTAVDLNRVMACFRADLHHISANSAAGSSNGNLHYVLN